MLKIMIVYAKISYTINNDIKTFNYIILDDKVRLNYNCITLNSKIKG